MKENIQKDVQQTMIYLCQKSPEKNVQVSPTLDQNYTAWYQKI